MTTPAAEHPLNGDRDSWLARRTWSFLRAYKGSLLAAILLLPVIIACELAQPKLLQLAVDRAIVVGNVRALMATAAAFFVAAIGQHGVGLVQRYYQQRLSLNATNDLRATLYRHILSLKMPFFDGMPVGQLITRVISDVDAMHEALSAGAVTFVVDLVRGLIIVIILLRTDARLTFETLACTPLLVVILVVGRKFMRYRFRDLRARLGALTGLTQEQLSGLKVLQILGRERSAAQDFARANDAYRNSNAKAVDVDLWVASATDAIGTAAIGALLLASSAKVASHQLSLGTVIAFVAYLERLFEPVRGLSTKFTTIQTGLAAAERVFALLDATNVEHRTVADCPASPETTTAEPPALEFDSVRFGYGAKEAILRDVSFSVRKGETIAVVGASGAGKTTLTKLATRLYEADNGRILLNGIDVRAVDVAELRRRIVVIPQEPFFFTASIADNVLLGDAFDDEADARLEAVATTLGADRIAATAQWHQHSLGNGGNVSAGEKQLLALTRALVRSPDVLILDEATANIDPATERLVTRATAKLTHSLVATIIIAHRISTLERADRIVVMHRGLIAECGTHSELVARDGLYTKLLRLGEAEQ